MEISGAQVQRSRLLLMAEILVQLCEAHARECLRLRREAAAGDEGRDALEGIVSEAPLRCPQQRLAEQPVGPCRHALRLAAWVARQGPGDGRAKLGNRPRGR